MKIKILFIAIALFVGVGSSYGQVLWSSAGGSAYLTTGNWTGNAVPTSAQIAQFGVNPTPGTSVGMNVNTATTQQVGAVEVTSARLVALTIGHSGTSKNSFYQLNGTTVNSVANVIVRNNSGSLLTFANLAVTGSASTLGLVLGNATDNIIITDNTGGVTISSIISGIGNLTKAGSGTGVLTLSGVNTYTGKTTVTAGELRLNPSANNSLSGACVFNGGTLSTAGITSTRTVTFSSVDISNNSTLALLASTNHTVTFTARGTFTPGKTLTITGWTGSYVLGTTGAVLAAPKVFIGNTASLTPAELAQIRFNNGTNNYAATQLITGEIIPTTSLVITTIANQIAGTGFDVIVSSKDLNGNLRALTNATGITLTTTTGGTISGTTTGTINAGSSATTISGVILTSGTSQTITATRDSGDKPIAVTSNAFDVAVAGPTITLAQLTAGIAPSPLLATTTDKAILGFSATATSAANMTAFNVGTSTTSVNKFTNIKLYSASTNDFSTATNTLVSGFSVSQTATQLQFSGFTEALSTTAKYYFITADIDNSVTAATAQVQPSLTNTNVTVSTGTITGVTITGTNYSFGLAPGTPTAALVIDGTGALTETNINTGTFTIDLTNDTFANFLAFPGTPIDLTTSNFTLNNAPTGTSINKVTATSAKFATVTLNFDGTDFDTNYTPTVTIKPAELGTSTTDLTSGSITITALNETITGATTTAAFTTTFGTASAAQTFAVSGSNTLRANLVATAPTGFEVSSDGGTTYGTTAFFTAVAANAGGISFKIRLAATAAIGTYNSQNIVLSSTGATSVNIVTPASGNSVNPSSSSDVAYNSGSSTSDNTNIIYANYQGITLSSTATSGVNACVGVMGLYLRDGGSSGVDADGLNTELTAITFTVTNAANIRLARLFDGNTPLGTPIAVTGGNTLAFTGISITAPDGGPQKSFNLRLTFNAAVTDNDKMVFTVSSVTANAAGSSFAATNGGGAYSDNAGGDINRIEVTADRLAFVQQPTNNSIGTNLSPSPTVSANDSLGNRDKDVTTGTITITSTGTLSTTQTATPVAGLATFASMAFTDAGTWQLTATYIPGTSALTFATSNTFKISPIIYIHGDYRSIGTGTWLGASPTASWEKYSTITGLWTTVSEPANNYATGGASLYIGAGTTITTGNTFGGVAIKVLSGGTFNCTYNSTATSLYIFDGGTASFSSNPLTISGDFEIEDNGTFIYNYKANAGNSASVRAALWKGTEKFHPKSNFIIKDHQIGADNYFLPVADTNISTQNYDGIAAYFGNLIIDLGSSLDNNTFRLTNSNTATNNSNFNNKILTYGDLIFRTSNSNTNPNLFYGSTTLTINGNLKIEDTYTNTNISGTPTSSTITGFLNVKGNFINESTRSFILNNSTAGTMTLNVDGNIQLNTTNSNAGTFNINSATGNVSTVNLKGDLTVGTTGLLTATLTTVANNTFNFSGTGDGTTAAKTQTIDITSTGLPTRNQYTNFNVNAGAYVQLANRDLELGKNSTFTVKGSGSTGGTLDFGFFGTTPLNLTSYDTGSKFASQQASTLKISSTDGISTTSGTVGNVRVTNAPTYDSVGIFHYIGKDNQSTGTGLPTASSAKIVIVELTDNAKTLSLTNGVSISNTITLDALGGKLDIRKGIVIGTTTADFAGSGRLVMSDGEYKISTITATPASDYLPQLSNYSNYSLTGGTVNLNATSATANQILSGTPTYYNLAFSGSNVLGTNYKGISNAANVTNAITISETAIVDVKSASLGGSPNSPSFTMNNTSRYITDGGGTKPDAGGTYALGSATTIDFANSSGDADVRLGTTAINYANVIVSGTKVSNASVVTGIKFQTGGTFTVKNGAIFKLQNTAGFTGSTATAISNANTPTVSLVAGSTIEYAKTTAVNTDDQSITPFVNTIIPTPTYTDTNSSYYNINISGAAKKIIPGTTEILVGNELTVTGGTLQIDSNKLLTVNNAIKNTSGNDILVKDSGNLIQITDVLNATANANTGNIKMTRTSRDMQNVNDYVYWGSPVKDNVFSQIPASIYDLSFQWDLTGAIDGAWNTFTATTPGRGFITRIKSGGTGQQSFNFTGTPNNGVVNVVAKSYTVDPNADETGNTILLANPYPSAMDAEDFVDANTAILDGTLYFWTSSTPYAGADYEYNDYATWNKSGGTATAPPPSNQIVSLKPLGKIAAGQGFFADIHADGNVTFNNTMRVRTTSDNSQFFRTTKATKTASEKNRVWLNLTNEKNAFRQTLVGYITGATNDFDRLYDGEAFTDNEINIYTIVDDKTLVIQGRALPFVNTDLVPLGYVITNAGIYKIAIDEVDGVLTNQTVYLEDKLLNVVHNLKTAPYDFSTTAGTFNERFVLRYTDKTLGTDDLSLLENQVLISNKNKQIKVNSLVESINKVVVYDIAGRQIYSKDKINNTEFTLTNLVSSQQTLLVKVVLENGQSITNKVMY